MRRYEKIAKTPYRRIMDHLTVGEEAKTKLREGHERLNPLVLEMEKRLKVVYDIQKRYGKSKI